jgi:hypothetical protein
MPSDPVHDLQSLWQNQPTGVTRVSSLYFREKAQQQLANARWLAIINAVMCAALLVFLGIEFHQLTAVMSRVGAALLATGALYVLFRRHRQLWPSPQALDAAPVTGLEAYRRELERTRDNSRRIWPMLAPLIPGAIVFALPALPPLVRKVSEDPSILVNAAPFLTLLAIWFALIFPIRRRKLLKLQREIDLLKDAAQ